MKETSYDLSELKPKVAGKNAACSGDFPQAGSTEYQIIVRISGSPEKEMGVQKPFHIGLSNREMTFFWSMLNCPGFCGDRTTGEVRRTHEQ
ncbi:hypothetical protein [Acetobacter thailandicus]|uniref:hypothetical protein n=1 Tax=Acetobacter thailandicus TaxID=1502842 RepID=UPI001BAA4148|nr:hypothetical protein [Acetobacter thailandicus]MBS0986995.1 hypothetical protein [Acetobacter thailandicus]